MRVCTRPRCQQRAVGMIDGDFISMCPQHALEFWSERATRAKAIVLKVKGMVEAGTLGFG